MTTTKPFPIVCAVCTNSTAQDKLRAMIIGHNYETICEVCYDWIRIQRTAVRDNAVGV